MRHRRPIRVIVLALLALLGWWLYSLWTQLQAPGPLVASGTIEADEVVLSAEVAGLLVEVAVEEGAAVRNGSLVAHINDELIQLQLRQADPTTRRQLEIQADRYVVRSPLTGTVTRVPTRAGELVVPGQVIAAVADLSRLRLTVYVPERHLGAVHVGQQVDLRADPFPTRTFPAVVTSINPYAEFTPRNVQTQRDRETLVFGVKVRVQNSDGALKPGLPVDAVFPVS